MSDDPTDYGCTPDDLDRVIRLADKNNVVLVPFDNVLDTDAVMQVNEDQLAMGRMWAEFAMKELKAAGVDRWVRGLEKASDHAPTWIEALAPQ